MAWSKIKDNCKKPLKWWVCKIICEFNYHFISTGRPYYKYLNKCIDCGFDLYGRQIKNHNYQSYINNTEVREVVDSVINHISKKKNKI